MNTGYIKLYRKTLDNPIIMKDSDHLAIWTYLLLNATHQNMNAVFDKEKIILKPGQLITGTLSMSKELKINKDKIQRTLKEFEVDKQINQQISSKGRLITVLNWEIYQYYDNQFDKQMINKCETTDKQLITNNNVISYYYCYLEKEYARTLSSSDIEVLDKLLSTYNQDLVMRAIKQSLVMNKKNLYYVKGILKNWKSEGINTVEDLNKMESEDNQSNTPIELFDYDWLNDKDERT